MRIWAISDLHLSENSDKPMNVFGPQWEGHWDRIREDWKARVAEEDIVLIGGDISWAMSLGEALADLRSIMEMPGKKVLLRGNHDYWWPSLSKLTAVLDERTFVLQNNALRFPGIVFAGTRGWTIAKDGASEEDSRIYQREGIRLSLSLKNAEQLRKPGDRLLVHFHYPPWIHAGETTVFTEQLEQIRPDWILFGHLHNVSPKDVPEGELRGLSYQLVSCDYLHFRLKEIAEI